jgi:hypothetical protein
MMRSGGSFSTDINQGPPRVDVLGIGIHAVNMYDAVGSKFTLVSNIGHFLNEDRALKYTEKRLCELLSSELQLKNLQPSSQGWTYASFFTLYNFQVFKVDRKP